MGWLLLRRSWGVTRSGLKLKPTRPIIPHRIYRPGAEIGRFTYGLEQPDSGSNHPRNLFVWRSNRLVPPAKATSICRSICWGPKRDSGRGTRCQRRDQTGRSRVQTAAIEGKLDLLVTLDFRMSVPACSPISFCPPPPGMKKTYEHLGYASVYSSAICGGRSGWESRSDWEIYKGIAKAFSQGVWVILAKKPTWYCNHCCTTSGRALTAV